MTILLARTDNPLDVFIPLVLFYTFSCLIAATVSACKGNGFFGIFVCSLIVTPVIGLFVALIIPDSSNASFDSETGGEGEDGISEEVSFRDTTEKED